MEGGLCIWEALSGRKATLCGARPGSPTLDFYPRPPRGGRLPDRLNFHQSRVISIHALREEGDDMTGRLLLRLRISIHALREEGDIRWGTSWKTTRYFYPRPPRGGRPLAIRSKVTASNFYPRPPRGGRLQNCTKKSDSKCTRRINSFENCKCF